MTEQTANDKTIGDIIRENNNLSPEQVTEILAYQKTHKVKFGEAAVALGFSNREDVLWALSQQFQYPYAASSSERISDELVAALSPFSDEAEIFRDVRSHLLSGVFSPDTKKPALAIVSSDTGDGKSFFAANLAVAFSQLGGRTLLIDCDMRTPRLQDIFEIDPSSTGLSSLLSGRTTNCVIRPLVDLPNLYVMPVGVNPPNPLELIQKPAFGMLLGELTGKFDQVIVDTPAAIHGSDARVIASRCGAALLVGRKNGSRLQQSKDLLEGMSKMGVRIAGAVMNEY
jgi:protein-tyrosine kinase